MVFGIKGIFALLSVLDASLTHLSLDYTDRIGLATMRMSSNIVLNNENNNTLYLNHSYGFSCQKSLNQLGFSDFHLLFEKEDDYKRLTDALRKNKGSEIFLKEHLNKDNDLNARTGWL